MELRKSKLSLAMDIPPLVTPFRGSTSIRYQASSSGSNLNFNYLCLARLLCFTTGTTSAQTLLEAVKINAIHFWLPPYSQSSATSSAVLDAPAPVLSIRIQDSAVNNIGPAKEVTMVAGLKGAYYCWRPKGIFRDWIDLIQVYQNAGVIFSALGTDAIPMIQLDFSYQLIVSRSVSGSSANSITVVVDSTTANALIALPLDNYSNSTTEGAQLMNPIGFATITVNDPSPDPSQWSEVRRRIFAEKSTSSPTLQTPPFAAAVVSSSMPPREASLQRPVQGRR